MRSQQSGPRVLYISLIPVSLQRVSVTAVSALRLVTSFPSSFLKSVLDAQSQALSSLTCSTVHEDPPSPPSNPGLLDDGWTALHSAARWNCSSCVETLLHHTPVNCTTHGGNTPLHLACQQNHRSTVELLLAHPAINTDMVNMQGDTPRMVAERVGNLGPLFDAVMPRGVRGHKE